MEEEGFVVWLPEEHLYGLGVGAFELSAELVRTRDSALIIKSRT